MFGATGTDAMGAGPRGPASCGDGLAKIPLHELAGAAAGVSVITGFIITGVVSFLSWALGSPEAECVVDNVGIIGPLSDRVVPEGDGRVGAAFRAGALLTL